MTPTTTPQREAERMRRIDAIRSAALVRQSLGITATYCRLPSDEHQVSVNGKVGIGDTLDQAIDAARREGGR
jgi:hypothetical protein